jgi:predicted phage terminase large subunit-like protein
MPSPANMYAYLLRHDLSAFIHRSFLELEPQTRFLPNWHIEVIAAKLEEVRRGRCKRLIVNVPPRHLKSHAISIAFPAWLLGHEPGKQILCASYAQDFSDALARKSRALMTSPFYQAVFDTRLSIGREAVSDFETTAGGNRLATSTGGVLTGRGADVIIVDDPLKADDAQSDARRSSANGWFDNTVRSRLNSQETGVIILVMQRLHADDLVAHVQEYESWEVLSFPVIAERDENYPIMTPYGRRRLGRKVGEILQPALMSAATIESQRRAMTEYNFTAQYQQDPQPPSGNIVKRDWLKFYDTKDQPDRFDQVVQSWDTANKDTELADFSVCTTWGLKGQKMYLLDVHRRKLNFPELKRAVEDLARLHNANLVLIEDKGSGTLLLQELRARDFSIAQAAPALDGDKIMRLRSQTAKIEGGFVLFPKEAHWLDAYVSELVSFPNSKYDDQVDSTVYALAWSTNQLNSAWKWIEYYRRLAERASSGAASTRMTRLKPPTAITNYSDVNGNEFKALPDGTFEFPEEEARRLIGYGWQRVDGTA